jgi:fatty-acyl-CoA synthase
MHTSLPDLVTSLAAREPDRLIFTFLYPDREQQTVTAGQLDRDASLIAAVLHEYGVRPGDILPLVFDHGYDLVAAFWGAMYLGAVPTILPYISHESRSQAFLQQVGRLVRFANASTVVTTDESRAYLEHGLADAACRILALPTCPLAGVERSMAWPTSAPSDPPYIQFSSGTTGSPKGVILSHTALLHYCHVGATDFAITSSDVTVGWLPLYHDMGLVNQIFEPLFFPHHSVLMSPTAWLREPHRLLEAIHTYRGTITWMPNFAFRYCTRRIRDGQIPGVDLSSWRIVGNASEPVCLDDLQAFATRFAAYGLNGNALTVSYGLAEHVAGVTWTRHDRAPEVDWVRAQGLEEGKAPPTQPYTPGGRPIVSCGFPLPSVALRIANDAGQELAAREVGEILVQSPMVCSGYYSLPDESAAALRDGWLHTGDLGYVADGQLYVCGRSKDLIIVGGRNIHPTHLEAIAAAVLGENGRFAAAFGVPSPHLGTETPVVVCEMRRLPDAATRLCLQQEMRAQAQRTLQLFVGDVYMVDKGWIVKTTSGKINRAANRNKYLSERAHAAFNAVPVEEASEIPASVTATERRLIGIWERLFERSAISGEDDFFALGGDSLLFAQLAVEIEAEFRCSLPATALLEAPTVSGLARLLDQPARPVAQPTLVPLQTAGTPTCHPVFFCVHGLGGGVLDYRSLARTLGSEQPFYALQARGVDGASLIDNSIEAMAAHYVETIKAFQPRGPYYLGGYCFGGVVAYEMAHQLTAAADTVALVAILEGYAPIRDTQHGGLWGEWRFAANFMRNLPYWLRDYLQLGRMRMQARNRRMIRVAGKRLLRLAGLKVELGVDDILDGLTSRPAQLQRVLECHLAAARRYAPTPYAGRVVLFRTPQRLLQAPEPDMGWSRLSTEPVDVQMIAGSHGTILEEPHVRVHAEKLRGFLSVSG